MAEYKDAALRLLREELTAPPVVLVGGSSSSGSGSGSSGGSSTSLQVRERDPISAASGVAAGVAGATCWRGRVARTVTAMHNTVSLATNFVCALTAAPPHQLLSFD